MGGRLPYMSADLIWDLLGSFQNGEMCPGAGGMHFPWFAPRSSWGHGLGGKISGNTCFFFCEPLLVRYMGGNTNRTT